MKAIAVIAVLVTLSICMAPAVSAQEAGDLRLNLTLTWDLGIRVGVGYRISDRVGVQADVGSSLFVLEGASLEAAYEFDGPWGVFLRSGAGVPFFLEDGEFGHRNTSYPLGLWPDLSAGATVTLR